MIGMQLKSIRFSDPVVVTLQSGMPALVSKIFLFAENFSDDYHLAGTVAFSLEEAKTLSVEMTLKRVSQVMEIMNTELKKGPPKETPVKPEPLNVKTNALGHFPNCGCERCLKERIIQ